MTSTDDKDEDPVTAVYDVFITPELASQIYLLQYPNRSRSQPYNERNSVRPLELRMKPKTGFLEVDVPLNVHANYDKQKGVQWGETIRSAKEQGAKSFGMAAGFGGLSRTSELPSRGDLQAAPAGLEEDEDERTNRYLADFDDANDKGHVMNRQTLGGQIVNSDMQRPLYMLGAFRGKELHLTKLSGIIQMRPQFHYLDAQGTLDIANRRREREAQEPSRVAEPRAVKLNIKPADNENVDIASTKNLLQNILEEPWTKLRYYDEDEEESYDEYHRNLFLETPEQAPILRSCLTNEEYLDAISVPRIDPSGKSKYSSLTKKQMLEVDISENEI